MLALAATGLAQAPEGYRTVYITSMVNKKFVVQPKTANAGSTLVVYVSVPRSARCLWLTRTNLQLNRQTLSNKPEQQWYLTTGKSKIQLAGTKLCMDAGAKSENS